MDFKKTFKTGFGSFTVPDTEESLNRFYTDKNGNIFNYGYTTVFNKSQKLNIGVRQRSYINVYSKDGIKTAKINTVGVCVYITQKNGFYYLLTQQKESKSSPPKVRLYKIKESLL